ncbi:MAG: hypothetical protein WBF90_36470 [Rivularia sp. (in: cyanobacteria)]
MSESRKSKFETESLQNLQRTGVIYKYFIEETAKVNIVMIWQKDDVSPILKKFLGGSNCNLISTHIWKYVPILSRYHVKRVIRIYVKSAVGILPTASFTVKRW